MNSIDLCCDYIENNKLEFGLLYEKICGKNDRGKITERGLR